MQDIQDDEERLRNQIAQLEVLAKAKLTRQALERYNTLRMAYPEKALQSATLIVQSNEKAINDEQLKRLLQLMESHKKETRIRRV